MDTFAHIALGALVCSRSGLPGGFAGPPGSERRRYLSDWTLWAAAGFGALPDLCSFGIVLFQRMLNGTLLQGKPPIDSIPPYIFFTYNWSHSLVTVCIIAIILAIFARKLLLPFAAWPLHILCDIPVHSKSYFSTKFLYPFSDFSIDGLSFATHPWIVYTYWTVILILFSAVVLMRYSNRLDPTTAVNNASSGG